MDTLQVDEYTDRDHLIRKKLATREKRQLHDLLWFFIAGESAGFLREGKTYFYKFPRNDGKRRFFTGKKWVCCSICFNFISDVMSNINSHITFKRPKVSEKSSKFNAPYLILCFLATLY
jgi:hypothetical protein